MVQKIIQNILIQSPEFLDFLRMFYKTSSATNIIFSKDKQYLGVASKLMCTVLENNGEINFENNISKKILNDASVDTFIYPKEKQLSVEQANEIVDSIALSPMDFKNKYYIIKNIEDALVSSQNKLLKSLEEPPKYVKFVLTSTNSLGVLPTILSRSQKYYLPQINLNDMSGVLEQEIKNSEIVKQMVNLHLKQEIIDLSCGEIGKYFEYMMCDKLSSILSLCESILTNYRSSTQILTLSSKICELKTNSKLFFEILNIYLIDLMSIKFSKQNNVLFKSKINFLNCVENQYSAKTIAQILKVIVKAQKKFKFNTSVSSIVDNFLIEFMEAKLKCN